MPANICAFIQHTNNKTGEFFVDELSIMWSTSTVIG